MSHNYYLNINWLILIVTGKMDSDKMRALKPLSQLPTILRLNNLGCVFTVRLILRMLGELDMMISE
ncbi:hypothetical protein AWI17_04510 [Enterobacter asburiae]|nr:hypothetical protein ABF78_01350 [Enterobacter asburiae]KUQ51899.1 hypothetical protein AWI17_04510 [Enterobacter asburiae]